VSKVLLIALNWGLLFAVLPLVINSHEHSTRVKFHSKESQTVFSKPFQKVFEDSWFLSEDITQKMIIKNIASVAKHVLACTLAITGV